LQGRWPVGLLRTFIPDPYDLQEAAVDIKANLWSWWAQYAIKKIQANDLSYEATEGKSGYGVGWTGGSFDLQGWLNKSNPNVNSFDLTALLEAAFSLLPDSPSKDSMSPLWVCMKPFPRIADRKKMPMVPFGWPATDPETGVQNPFFKGIGMFSGSYCRLSSSLQQV